MIVETVFSVSALGAFIWVVRDLVPKAVRERDAFALGCAVLTAVLVLLAYLWVGVGSRSAGP